MDSVSLSSVLRRGLHLLANGNESAMQLEREKDSVAATIQLLDGREVRGVHTGSRIVSPAQSYGWTCKCLSLRFLPRYTLWPVNHGTFTSIEVKYEGDFFNGAFHGQGILQDFSNHRKYCGTFYNGSKEGMGIEYRLDSEGKQYKYYEGSWKEDEYYNGWIFHESGKRIARFDHGTAVSGNSEVELADGKPGNSISNCRAALTTVPQVQLAAMLAQSLAENSPANPSASSLPSSLTAGVVTINTPPPISSSSSMVLGVLPSHNEIEMSLQSRSAPCSAVSDGETLKLSHAVTLAAISSTSLSQPIPKGFEGRWHLKNLGNGMVLEAQAFSHKHGCLVLRSLKSNRENQIFIISASSRFMGNGQPLFSLQEENTGLFLDAFGGFVYRGAGEVVHLFQGNGVMRTSKPDTVSPQQLFSIQPLQEEQFLVRLVFYWSTKLKCEGRDAIKMKYVGLNESGCGVILVSEDSDQGKSVTAIWRLIPASA